MTETWDELQEEVNAEMQKIYSETVIDHAMNPRNVGRRLCPYYRSLWGHYGNLAQGEE